MLKRFVSVLLVLLMVISLGSVAVVPASAMSSEDLCLAQINLYLGSDGALSFVELKDLGFKKYD